MLSEQATKVLCKLKRLGNRLITLDKLLQIGPLLRSTILCWSHRHKRDASGRRRLIQSDCLFGDGACDLSTKGAKPHLKGALGTRISLSDNFLVQPGYVVASLVPSRSQVGKVGINNGGGARPSTRRRRCFLFKDTIDLARTDSNELGNLLFVTSLPIQLPDPLMKTHLLAMTSTTLLCYFFRHRRLGSRTGVSCTLACRLFEHVFLD